MAFRANGIRERAIEILGEVVMKKLFKKIKFVFLVICGIMVYGLHKFMEWRGHRKYKKFCKRKEKELNCQK